jgi:hypothetical protein
MMTAAPMAAPPEMPAPVSESTPVAPGNEPPM